MSQLFLIFVNPTQFNDKQDLINYPVSINEDLFLLKRAKCEIVFIPKKEENLSKWK